MKITRYTVYCKNDTTYLPLCVHEQQSVATVTDDKLVGSLGEKMHGVDGDVSLTA